MQLQGYSIDLKINAPKWLHVYGYLLGKPKIQNYGMNLKPQDDY